jgi:DNA-binding MarR family transcriptional regulator
MTMSKNKIKDLIKNQAEESISRIQDGYSWRNSLFGEDGVDITNGSLTLPEVVEINDVNKASIEAKNAPSGVSKTPLNISGAPHIQNAGFENTPHGVINTPCGVDEISTIKNEKIESTSEFSNSALDQTLPIIIYKGDEYTPDDVILTPSGVNKIEDGVNETPNEVLNTPNEVNTTTENIYNDTDVIKTPNGVDRATPFPVIGVNETTQTSLSGVNGTTLTSSSGVIKTTSGVSNTTQLTQNSQIKTTGGVNKTTEIPSFGVYETTQKEEFDVKKTTEEALFGVNKTTREVRKTTKDGVNKTPLLGQTNDLYLVGLWHVLSIIFPDGYGHYTLRGLAKRLNMDHSNLLRSLKRAERAGLLKTVSSNDGTYLEIRSDIALFQTHQDSQEEDDFKSLLPHFNDPNFEKKIQLKESLSAIFWAILAAKKQPEEISGSTFDVLMKIGIERGENYAAAFVFKYLPRAKSNPTAFFKTILDKESDPLSKIEIEIGKETNDAGHTLLKSDPEAIGLSAMRSMGRRFFLDMGGSIEECKQLLQEIKARHDALISYIK